MAEIFDGKLYSLNKLEELKKEVLKLKKKGIFPHLVSIIIGNNPASKLYVGLKKKTGEKIGIEVSVYYLPISVKKEEIILLIDTLNKDKNINGIMVQMPLPDSLISSREKIINSIEITKDVDGLRSDSKFLHPTASAILQIVKEAEKKLKKTLKTIAVVGEHGMVGSSLVREIKNTNYKLLKEKNKVDILVSATGQPNLIKADMIKEGVVLIDVGSPKGDVDFNDVLSKVSFITPVPGGVGPVTIISLLENLIKASC